MQTDWTNYSLGSVSLFEAVDPNDLDDMQQVCRLRHYRAGEEILAYMDASNEVYFVVSGKARVIIYSSHGRPVGFRELMPGDMFGEYAAIDGGSRSASIEAEADCVVAVMSSNEFQNLVWHNPDLSRALTLHLTKQLRALTRRIYEFSTLAVNNRIQAEILRLARESMDAQSLADETTAQITPAPTHAAIAARISTHREAVSRHLSSLTKAGIIQRKGRSLIVTDVARLERMVRDALGE